MRRKCLAIGVSRAEDLTPLYAAASAAEEICEWAHVTGFAGKDDIVKLTDREGEAPVTIARIRQAIETLLPAKQSTDTFLLFFAGHGLREDSTRTLWLPTDWRSELRAVSVERLKNRLNDYGIGNLTIISDACKTLPADRESSDLTPDAVLGLGPTIGKYPILDRYDAVHDIDAAFMIPGETPAESRCLFSGAMLEGLWGLDAKAFDGVYPDKVTPGSLSEFVKARVEELCKTYRLQCRPQNIPGYPPDHVIYFDRSQPLNGDARTQVAWPEPIRPQVPPTSVIKSIGRRGPAGGAIGWAERPVYSRNRVPQHKQDWLIARAEGEVKQEARAKRRAERDRSLASLFADMTLGASYEQNLVLVGDTHARIWSPTALLNAGLGRWLGQVGQAGEQVVAEYSDGVFVPAVIYPHLTTIVARDEEGVAGWICAESSGPRSKMSHSLDVMSRFRNGEISPSDVDSIAAKLRSGKHLNPVLGAISAYLYDYVGDIESIRRMAAYYIEHDQPIPFDIALTGGLEVETVQGGTAANVAPVAARWDHADGQLPDYVTAQMPGGKGHVGGRCPWLRQGWDLVDPGDPALPPVAGDLPDLRKHLLPSAFTSLDPAGGKLLTQHWRMEVYA